MNDWLLILVALVYFIVSGALFLFGVNFIYMSILTWRKGRTPAAIPEMLIDWPSVTVQLPIFNEAFVVDRLIDAAVRLDYPTHRLQIQVLDDSTDATTEIAAARVEAYRQQGVNIELIHRDELVPHQGAHDQGLAVDGREGRGPQVHDLAVAELQGELPVLG